MLNSRRFVDLAAKADRNAMEALDPALQEVFREMAAQWRVVAHVTARTETGRPVPARLR
jgi:hypothetical protein